MMNFNLEEFKDVSERYIDYKIMLRSFIIENAEIFKLIQPNIKYLSHNTTINDIQINCDIFTMTILVDYGEEGLVEKTIKLPIECLTYKDNDENEFMLYLKLKQKYEKYEEK